MAIPVGIPIALAAAGAAAKWYGAKQAAKPMETQAVTPGQIRGYMAPIQSSINQMQGSYGQMMGYGQDLMDPNSGVNLQQKGMMGQQGANQMALQTLLQNRQRAAMGGGNSGIMLAQQRAQQQNLQQNLGQQFGNQMMQNRTQGLGIMGNQQSLLGNIGKMQMGVQENIGQAAISQRNWQMSEEMRQRKAQQAQWEAGGEMLSGFGSSLAGI